MYKIFIVYFYVMKASIMPFNFNVLESMSYIQYLYIYQFLSSCKEITLHFH